MEPHKPNTVAPVEDKRFQFNNESLFKSALGDTSSGAAWCDGCKCALIDIGPGKRACPKCYNTIALDLHRKPNGRIVGTNG